MVTQLLSMTLFIFFCAPFLFGCEPVSELSPPKQLSTTSKAPRSIGQSAALEDLRDKNSIGDKIKQDLRKRLGRVPRSKDYLNYAKEMMKARDNGIAVLAASMAIDGNPRCAEAYLVRAKAQSYSVSGDTNSIGRDLERAIQIQSDLPEAYELLADFYDSQKRYEKAVKFWTLAIAAKPNDSELYCRRSASLCALGRRQEALSDLDIFIAARPRRAMGYRIKAGVLVEMQRFDDALKLYDLALKYEQGLERSYVLNLRADLYSRMNRHNDAIKDFSALIDFDPQNDDAWRLRGEQYIKLGKYEKAIEDYTKAIDIAPEFARASLIARSRAYRKIGRQDLAEIDENQARTLSDRPAEIPIYELQYKR